MFFFIRVYLHFSCIDRLEPCVTLISGNKSAARRNCYQWGPYGPHVTSVYLKMIVYTNLPRQRIKKKILPDEEDFQPHKYLCSSSGSRIGVNSL